MLDNWIFGVNLAVVQMEHTEREHLAALGSKSVRLDVGSS